MNETSHGRDGWGDDDPQSPSRGPLWCCRGAFGGVQRERWRCRQVRGTGGLRWGYLVRPVVPGRKAYLYRCVLVLESLYLSVFLFMFNCSKVSAMESVPFICNYKWEFISRTLLYLHYFAFNCLLRSADESILTCNHRCDVVFLTYTLHLPKTPRSLFAVGRFSLWARRGGFQVGLYHVFSQERDGKRYRSLLSWWWRLRGTKGGLKGLSSRVCGH